ncbi:hypothetical protein JYU34_009386 [Plutella xylostella]|uniref:Uncharacterized protein n=1 Tax=Plutella xylostella TaxID=51655 RepID=A0ABQ7QJB9_PLUXY|nr:hypothetical protein JYU34_009386 [Plutella xylostella]
MGPQFVFKTYTHCGSNSSLSEAEAVEVETSVGRPVARSNPVNVPGVRPIVPVLIDSGSASSLEQSPSDSFRRKSLLSESGRASVCDVQLREDLAEAMKEDQGIAASGRFEPEPEELSSSSFSSASRASLDPPSSPTPSCGGDNLLQFPGDSSSSV